MRCLSTERMNNISVLWCLISARKSCSRIKMAGEFLNVLALESFEYMYIGIKPTLIFCPTHLALYPSVSGPPRETNTRDQHFLRWRSGRKICCRLRQNWCSKHRSWRGRSIACDVRNLWRRHCMFHQLLQLSPFWYPIQLRFSLCIKAKHISSALAL